MQNSDSKLKKNKLTLFSLLFIYLHSSWAFFPSFTVKLISKYNNCYLNMLILSVYTVAGIAENA